MDDSTNRGSLGQIFSIRTVSIETVVGHVFFFVFDCYTDIILLTNVPSLLKPNLGISALDRFRTDLAELVPYCHDPGPIFPGKVVSGVSMECSLFLSQSSSTRCFCC